MAKASDNQFPSVLFVEQGSTPATPAAGTQRLFFDDTGALKAVDDTGAVSGVGGSGSGDATWTAPTLTNSWVNYGGSATNAGYRKDASGIVWLRGAIKNGTNATSAFTLPVGYRPSSTQTFAVVGANSGATANTLATVKTEPDGTVVIAVISGGTGWIYLDGIAFFAA